MGDIKLAREETFKWDEGGVGSWGGDPLMSGTSRPTTFATVSLKEPWRTSTGEMLEGHGVVGDLGPVGCLQVISHTVIEGEQQGRGTDLSTYVADSGHSGSWE